MHAHNTPSITVMHAHHTPSITVMHAHHTPSITVMYAHHTPASLWCTLTTPPASLWCTLNVVHSLLRCRPYLHHNEHQYTDWNMHLNPRYRLTHISHLEHTHTPPPTLGLLPPCPRRPSSLFDSFTPFDASVVLRIFSVFSTSAQRTSAYF